jgi:uncharacterized membrane protein
MLIYSPVSAGHHRQYLIEVEGRIGSSSTGQAGLNLNVEALRQAFFHMLWWVTKVNLIACISQDARRDEINQSSPIAQTKT